MVWAYDQWYMEITDQPRDGEGRLHAANIQIPRRLIPKADFYQDEKKMETFAAQLEEALGGRYKVIAVCRPANIDAMIVTVCADFLEPVIGLAQFPNIELTKEQAMLIDVTFN